VSRLKEGSKLWYKTTEIENGFGLLGPSGFFSKEGKNKSKTTCPSIVDPQPSTKNKVKGKRCNK